MANQFSSKYTFKFVNALYKRAVSRARREVGTRRDYIEEHVYRSKDALHNASDNNLAAMEQWAIGMWRNEIESHASRYFSSKELKLSSFKRLNEKSGLLALLKEMYIYGRNFDWAEIVKMADFNKVISAYTDWCQQHARDKKVRFKTLNSYASNYYNSYRAWLHKIGAIQQTGRKGLWKLTQFGHDMAKELIDWYDKKSQK